MDRGWYADPDRPGVERYWSGAEWTGRTRAIGPVAPPPVQAPGSSEYAPPSELAPGRPFWGIPRGRSRILLSLFGAVIAVGGVVLAIGDLTGHHSSPGAPPSPHALFGHPLTLPEGGGDDAVVVVTGFIDPVRTFDSEGPPSPGNRFLAVTLTFSNPGSSPIFVEPYQDVSATGSDGQAYPVIVRTFSNCASFPLHQGLLDPAQTETGCVGFDVPSSVSLTEVSVSLSAGTSNGTGQWTAS